LLQSRDDDILAAVAIRSDSLNRRRVLAGGAASVLGVSGLSAQPPSSSNVKVSIIWDGVTYGYPDGPKIPSYYVLFREDGRILFHLGALGNLSLAAPPTIKAYHLPAHQVRIERDGKIVLDETLPGHWWSAQWTYRPKPLAVVKTPAQIVTARRMFPFGRTGATLERPAPRVPYRLMGASNIVRGMPMTGERSDIGLITENSGHFMLGDSPDPMIDWALSAASCPMHYRDEATGKPIDLTKYPSANCNDLPGLAGWPYLPKGPKMADPFNYQVWGGGWVPQQAHYCEMSYVAYLATEDPAFLEDLQYSANFTVLCDAAKSMRLHKAIPSGEYRGIAWAFRNLFMAHAATLDAEAAGRLPDSCHPSSYFKTLLDNTLAWYSKSMTDPASQAFRLVSDLVIAGNPRVPVFAPWQCDYMLQALAFGVLTGHSDWTPLYLWALGNAIARSDAASGYPPGWGGAYYLDGTKPNWESAFLAGVPGLGGAEPPSPEQVADMKADPYHGGSPVKGAETIMITRAVLVMADYLDKKGLAGVRQAYPNFDACLKNMNRMFSTYGRVNARVSVVAG
jgi:hypothetical protein